jgi:hypothetical protein
MLDMWLLGRLRWHQAVEFDGVVGVLLLLLNIYCPVIYRDRVIEAMISAFHAKFSIHPDHAVEEVWLRRQFHSHIANC